MLIAGVVPVKDLYHMACVPTEQVPKNTAKSQVRPSAGRRACHAAERFTGTRANLISSESIEIN